MNKAPIKRSRHSLKFLCWNINHSRDKNEGAKVDIPEVSKLFNNHDIFALQETKGVINFKNYRCFNSNRKGSNSGGVCIGVHKSLQNGVVSVHVETTEDIVAVKLKSNFFDLDRDTYLINTYDSPANGSFKKRKQALEQDDHVTTLEHLQEFLATIPISNDVILLGDFNARTGTLDDVMSADSQLGELELHDFLEKEINKRNNRDKTLNSNGRPFIELLQTSGLVILNGRTLGDIFGEPTCIQRHGVSTVDYICVTPSLCDRVRKFKVDNISQYSDHRALSLSIATNPLRRASTNLELAEVQDAPKPFKWTRSDDPSLDTSTKFTFAQNDQRVQHTLDTLLDRQIDSPDGARKLNDDVTKLYHNISSSVTSIKTGKRTNKKKWFDRQCRRAKTEANRADRNAGQYPHSTFLRGQRTLKRKQYQTLKSSKKGKFLREMNSKINEGSDINWAALKQLSDQHKDEEPFDIFDLLLFHKFFNDLYNRKCGNNHQTTTASDPTISESDELVNQLNCDFTLEEVNDAIKKLQNNKSVSDDLISNEMLKNSGDKLKRLLVKLFNMCLQHGTYPWNNSITTPLHKKGDRQNPDNYRAITIGSCLGKLFSSLLLNRLTEFRETACPDKPNQLGFRKGAQCSDHILALNTVIEKYVKRDKRRVFACFVDYRKAFDSVCREALLFKLANMGLAGGFFKCIKHMYSSSSTRIKLIQKLSSAIDVTIGTEQGHPMSPELFKLYIHELSVRLDEIEDLEVPLLNGYKVSHLLWADDLVLLALDPKSLQKLLDCLNDYADKWELSVNISKTNVMVFNTSSRLLNCAYGFKLGNLDIAPVNKYTYLGIQVSLNGSFKRAIDELRKKALRSFFSLRRIVDTRALTTKTMLKLIDSLVKPVATYGCQVWLPSTNLIKSLLSVDTNPAVSLPKAATKDALELTHLRLLKWTLGVHKKANNNFCYGDTGRIPWSLSVLPQCISYFNRASQAADGGVDTLLYHTFHEQQRLDLTWFNTWSRVRTSSSQSKPHLAETTAAREYSQDIFMDHWQRDLQNQPKMAFYSSVKTTFGEEMYLQLPSRPKRSSIAKLRSSSHDLRIEVGRYTKNKTQSKIEAKVCRFCCTAEPDTLSHFEELPFSEPTIIESEEHALTECPGYHSIRSKLSDNLKSLIMLKAYGVIMSCHHVSEFGRYLIESWKLRNPNRKFNSN